MPTKTKKTTAAKPLSAEETLAKMEAEGLAIGLEIPEQKFYSTGNMAIDLVCGGGLPVGRVITLAGPQASGKTTTAVSSARSVIEEFDRRVLFVDYERTLDVPYFRSLGVEPENNPYFVRYAPKTLEEGFNNVRRLVKTGEFGMVIFDSVAKMLTEKELEGDIASGMNLEKSKLLRAALSQANDYAFDNDTSIVLLNHLMEKVDITFLGQQMAARGIKQYTMPGGTGPFFYSSMILWFAKLGQITSDIYDPITNSEAKQKIGYRHKVTVAKNKVGKPDGEVEVVNILGEGFSNPRTAFEVLLAHGAIHKNGSWFNAREERLKKLIGDGAIQGSETIYETVFKTDPETRGTAITIAREYLQQAYDAIEEREEVGEESYDRFLG